MSCTREVTVQVIHPDVTEAVVAADPVVPGCVAHSTPASVQEPEASNALIVRPVTPTVVKRRSVAEVIEQPVGIVGSAKRTSPRRIFTLLESALTSIVAAVAPLDGLSCCTVVSASGLTVSVPAVQRLTVSEAFAVSPRLLTA